MSSQKPPLATGSRWIWPFEILEQLGEGGMGVVYRARYVVNDRHVALKMVPSDVTDKTALARFERELEILKTLRHPNIVRCFGGSCEDKRRFYAMELVEGGNIDEQLQNRGKLPWEQVVHLARQMCAALDASHSKGVIHRDIKPSNFLMTTGGELKLSDFGLASVMASRKITAAGKTAGTFLYMAPEQIRGEEITPRTDLYALGCVLYELVTGKPPFVGATPAATLHMHCHNTPVRPSSQALDCPVELESLILQLISKPPADRPSSAALVAHRLVEVYQAGRVSAGKRPRLEVLETTPLPPLPKSEQPSVVEAPRADVKTNKNFAIRMLGVLLALAVMANLIQWGSAHGNSWRSAWEDALRHSSQDVRLQAVQTLAQHLNDDHDALEHVISATTDSNTQVRAAAVRGLGQATTLSYSLNGALNKIQRNDESDEVRTAAAAAIERIKSGQNATSAWKIPVFGVVLLIVLGSAAFWYWGTGVPHPAAKPDSSSL